MIKFELYVLAGNFKTEIEASQYADMDYSIDEDNPVCLIKEALGGIPIDLDYIETIFGDDRFEYLQSMLVNPSDVDIVKDKSKGENTLFLIMGIEQNRKIKIPNNIEPLSYCGSFSGRFQEI